MPYRKNDTSRTKIFKMSLLYTHIKHILNAPNLTFGNILICIRPILDTCYSQETDFTRQKPKMETVLFAIFSILEIILTNPYVHCDYSNFKNRTIVRKTVPYSTIFRRKMLMKLEDKHKESSIKCSQNSTTKTHLQTAKI